MRPLTVECVLSCVLLLQNVFSHCKMCSLTSPSSHEQDRRGHSLPPCRVCPVPHTHRALFRQRGRDMDLFPIQLGVCCAGRVAGWSERAGLAPPRVRAGCLQARILRSAPSSALI